LLLAQSLPLYKLVPWRSSKESSILGVKADLGEFGANGSPKAVQIARRKAPVVFAPDLMMIVVIGSSPSLLLCVGVWVGAMVVMTTFFSK
ncbi:hypothetical protein Gotri_004395, partial [Gossypium trilobum]|nr:hypothetical protein [Gossypium trilobum]